MPYKKIKSHVTESVNLSAELVEILLHGKTMGSKSKDVFELNIVQTWGLRHLMVCRDCSQEVQETINMIAVEEGKKLSSPPF